MSVSLRVLGKSVYSTDYRDGMTVADVLSANSVVPGNDVVITVNGERAVMETVVPENATVTVTPNISNG